MYANNTYSMDILKELEEALDRLKNAHMPDEIKKAVAIADIVKLLAEERNASQKIDQ